MAIRVPAPRRNPPWSQQPALGRAAARGEFARSGHDLTMYNSAVDGVATRVTYTTTPSVTTRASGAPTIGSRPGSVASCPNAQRSTTVLAPETQLPVTIPISVGAKRYRTSVRAAREAFANSPATGAAVEGIGILNFKHPFSRELYRRTGE